jgi:hypothetical protein
MRRSASLGKILKWGIVLPTPSRYENTFSLQPASVLAARVKPDVVKLVSQQLGNIESQVTNKINPACTRATLSDNHKEAALEGKGANWIVYDGAFPLGMIWLVLGGELGESDNCFSTVGNGVIERYLRFA